ncbi:AAA family ATPase [Caenimonas aquaedulcis]|uniref:AAA family ATPase n=1 Tax=Caenimonas aquaedulcis TaxID=2793270 RepID=A0A931H2D5_9BURK|nr:AAA family ATPase [Caenimonas aquaedulcis]MBG9387255.1 AAA family ATPase [Caenimonas aquaedulcis]
MYAPYFGLKGEPFSIAPDPRFLFMSERHREALAHLLYGLGSGGGFVLLSGEIGTGKTTVCRLFLEQIPPGCNVAYIFNPKLTVIELLQSICDEFHIAMPRTEGPPTVKALLDPLNDFLLAEHAAGRNNVLIIDEAQNLSAEVLEQLRLLTNLETRERKLLQIILIGQPELRAMLARPELEQLAQRVIARFHLGALTPAETARYVQHRLEVAGLSRPMPFERTALQRIHELSRGVPRRINLLCDRALLGAFANSQASVDRATVDKAAGEVFDTGADAPRPDHRRSAALVAAGLAAGAALFAVATHFGSRPAPPSLGAAVAAAPSRASSGASAPASPATTAALAPTLLTSFDDAWRELAKSWKVSPLPPGDACKALQAERLQCFRRSLSLAEIRELGRPGILTLDAGGGAPRYAVLTALDRESATLVAAGVEQRVSIAALAGRWQGDFATLWQQPPGFDARKPAATAPETRAWMTSQLGPGPSFGAQLKAFQLSHGLAADGQPGPMTFMQLNRAAGVEEPRLRNAS